MAKFTEGQIVLMQDENDCDAHELMSVVAIVDEHVVRVKPVIGFGEAFDVPLAILQEVV